MNLTAAIFNLLGVDGVIILLIPLFTLWMSIDCAVYERSQDSDKIVWILIILFVPILGPLAYLFIRKFRREDAAP